MRIVFLGTLYPENMEETILAKSKQTAGSAPNVFQWNLIHGLEQNLACNVEIVNALPVGTWPRAYADLLLPTRSWQNGSAPCREIGCINLPFLKQLMRSFTARRELKKLLRPGDHVVLYSPYLPFLRALKSIKNVTVTVIVTDLPEYYDLGQTSPLRRWLRKRHTSLVYRALRRADRYVLLTQAMKQPLGIQNQPWLLMEGVCALSLPQPAEASPKKSILYTGTLHYQFGIKTLLDAFCAMEDPDLELWICGAGEAEAEIRQLEHTDPRVRFFGFVNQKTVAELRRKAAMLVNPRTNEGEYTKYSFPSKTMEYMLSGKPVVMYPLDGVPAEYAPYLFLVDQPGADGLRLTMESVLADPEAAAEKAAAAQRFVAQHKSPAAQGRRLIEFLQK